MHSFLDNAKTSILVVGANSSIGSSLVNYYYHLPVNVITTTRRSDFVNNNSIYFDLKTNNDISITDYKSIRTAFICAAITSIEQCESNPEGTFQINVVNTVALAKKLIDIGIFVVFLSSNAVFSGEIFLQKNTDITTPVTQYGLQKAEAEKQLINLNGSVAILRFSKIISSQMPLVQSWLCNLQSGKVINPFFDMVMSPISMSYAVSLLKKISDLKIPGIFQASATQDITYADFAHYLCEKLGTTRYLIQPISYRDSGIRFSPKNTALNCESLNILGFHSPLPSDSLNQCFQSL